MANKNTLKTELANFSLEREQELRTVEKQLAAVSQQDLRTNVRISEVYLALGKISLANNVNLNHDARVQMDLRTQEETAVRNRLSKTESDIAAASITLDAAEKGLREANAHLATILDSDNDYLKDVSDLKRAELQLLEAGATEAEIQRECDSKLPAYSTDRIFAYLLARNYAKPSYIGGGLTKVLDRWLAVLISFEANLANYESLQEIRGAVYDRRRVVEKVKDSLVKSIENRTVAAQATTNLEPAQRAVKVAQETIESLKVEAKRIQVSLQEYSTKKDIRYIRASQAIAKSMESVPIEDLQRAAQESPGLEDDELVLELVELRKSLSDNVEKTKKLTAERNSREMQYSRAKTIERELRAERFTGPEYTYRSDFSLSTFLAGYMAGEMNSSQVSSQLLSERVHVPPPPPREDDTWSRSTFSPASSSSSRSRSSSDSSPSIFSSPSRSDESSWGGGGGGGGSYSTGDSTGGGSYSTGDSF